jgi:hypothetical protein
VHTAPDEVVPIVVTKSDITILGTRTILPTFDASLASLTTQIDKHVLRLEGVSGCSIGISPAHGP